MTFRPHVYVWGFPNPPPVRPRFYYSWYDEITGEVLGDTESLTVRLSPGLHRIVFYVSEADAGNSARIQFRVLVHDP